MEASCHECGEPQGAWMVARCSNPTKGVACGEAFCFKCLSQKYPHMYGSIFKGLWWLCPACMGMCKCDTCSDPVKRAEYQRVAKRKMKKQKPVPVDDMKPLKLRSGTVHSKAIPRPPETPPTSAHAEEPENGWTCSRCSIVNSLDDIECIACCCHRKRNMRKRPTPAEPLHEEKFHAYKETRRTEPADDKSAPVK